MYFTFRKKTTATGLDSPHILSALSCCSLFYIVGYVNATDSWLTKIYEKEYNTDNSTVTLDVLQSEIVAASYDPWMNASHTILLRTVFVFLLEDEESAPTEMELVDVLGDANLMDYMLNFLHTSEPHFNVFIGKI